MSLNLEIADVVYTDEFCFFRHFDRGINDWLCK